MAERTAIVAGGGIGGLTAGIALMHRGWRVTVLERASDIAEVGAGIQLGPNAVTVLRRLGVDIAPAAFRPEALEMRRGRSGRQVFRIAIDNIAEQRWGAPYLHIARFDLIDALVRRCGEMRIRTQAKVVAYQQDTDKVRVRLADGEELTGDILIGADGIRSRIRRQILGEDRPRFTGNVAWRILIPSARLGELAPPPTACVWVGQGRHAVTYRVHGGLLTNLVAVVEHSSWRSESWTEQGTAAEALNDFRGWHPTITTIFEQADAHYRWALYDREPLPIWTDGRVALLGDACHPMLPFLAQGASMAIEDAWVLADHLDREPNHRRALTEYADTRRPRTTRVQSESRENASRFHHSELAYAPIQLAARIRPQSFVRRFDWLYGHDVTA
ncbi:FAD-dependent monooxygenase [Nocardia cyriacigeorgica]|uniref:FAD-dependent monooxygenase n=1 Tax=Nocardia cyriacigeorgica TaxID=135487 RepID=UPI0024564B01|nr:FAD-dependent monooxygenase [Nocardia cyriacigeorgica]